MPTSSLSVRTPVGEPAGPELGWLAGAATLGVVAGLVSVLLPLYAVRDLTFPLRWGLLPDGEISSPWWWRADGWADAWAVALLSLGWAALTVGAVPRLARLHAGVARRLLAPPPGTDLTLRIAELTVTRASALDAHVAEMRRIERSLHDGTQNRPVAATVLLGSARRSLARDPSTTDALLERAQDAAEQALADRRAVVRGILPPVLADRGAGGRARRPGRDLRRAVHGRRRRAGALPGVGGGDRLVRRRRGTHQRRPPQRGDGGRGDGAPPG